jgi:hypothetical protein
MSIRINNIGIKQTGFVTEKTKELKLSIVKYHENQYYGMLDEYLNSGWQDKDAYLKKCGGIISKDLFSKKESYYTIAFLRLNREDKETVLESVGDRLLYITPKERDDFFAVYEKANDNLQKEIEKISNNYSLSNKI